MLKKLIIRYYRKPMSQHALLLCDMLMVVVLFFLTKLANFQENFFGIFNQPEKTLVQLAIVVVVYLVAFLIFAPYKSMMRYTGLADLIKVFYSGATAFVAFVLFKIAAYLYKPVEDYFLWGRELLLLSAMVLVAMTFVRLVSRFLYDAIMNRRKKEIRRIVIYGAGDAGKLTYNVLTKDSTLRNIVVAFADDNPQ